MIWTQIPVRGWKFDAAKPEATTYGSLMTAMGRKLPLRDQGSKAERGLLNIPSAPALPCRLRSSSRKQPIIRLVVIITPGVPTPRAVMQAWLASITTATPLGSRLLPDAVGDLARSAAPAPAAAAQSRAAPAPAC